MAFPCRMPACPRRRWRPDSVVVVPTGFVLLATVWTPLWYLDDHQLRLALGLALVVAPAGLFTWVEGRLRPTLAGRGPAFRALSLAVWCGTGIGLASTPLFLGGLFGILAMICWLFSLLLWCARELVLARPALGGVLAGSLVALPGSGILYLMAITTLGANLDLAYWDALGLALVGAGCCIAAAGLRKHCADRSRPSPSDAGL